VKCALQNKGLYRKNKMNISEQLEIILPTYNRKDCLARTLTQLMAQNSPVRDCKITVLDNCSTDGSSAVIDDFAAKYKNLTHIRHEKNIGGNANITRAFEMARAEYVWVLCDDDEYDFSHAEELEAVLQTKPAGVLVVQHNRQQLGIGEIFQECSFVPGAIYRTDLITSEILFNMYFSVSNMFPHLAVTAGIINAGEEIVPLPHPMIIRTPAPGYLRGLSGNIHPFIKEMDWILGYLSTVLLLTDAAQRTKCVRALNIDGDNFYNLCGRFMSLRKNKILLYGLGLRLFPQLYKLKFALYAWPAYVCSFYKTEHGLYVRLFGKFKTKIWR